jgi:hypothetical protein
MRMNQLVLDPLPDDSRHFIAIEIHNGIGNFDLGHMIFLEKLKRQF